MSHEVFYAVPTSAAARARLAANHGVMRYESATPRRERKQRQPVTVKKSVKCLPGFRH